MKVQPPDDSYPNELENSRRRLYEITDDRQFDLSKKLCSMAHADLQWLSHYGYGMVGQQGVLGPGSVVLRGGYFRDPTIILRPEVWHKYVHTTHTIERELAYTGTDNMGLRGQRHHQETGRD